LPSTLTYAKENIKEIADNTVITANTQTAGRGQFNRSWFSPPGTGIYCSIVRKPQSLHIAEIADLTIEAAKAVASVVAEITDAEVTVKFPNDVLADGKKICGILVETATVDGLAEHIIIGIGLNVNTEKSDFPPELRDTATSLKIIAGREFDMDDVLEMILEEL